MIIDTTDEKQVEEHKERLKEIVDGYNNMIEEKLKNGEVPTNNQILGIEPVITKINSNGYGGK